MPAIGSTCRRPSTSTSTVSPPAATQRPLEPTPPVDRLRQLDVHVLAHEPREMPRGAQRPVEPRRRHLERVVTRHRVLGVEHFADRAAHPLAVVDRDAARWRRYRRAPGRRPARARTRGPRARTPVPRRPAARAPSSAVPEHRPSCTAQNTKNGPAAHSFPCATAVIAAFAKEKSPRSGISMANLPPDRALTLAAVGQGPPDPTEHPRRSSTCNGASAQTRNSIAWVRARLVRAGRPERLRRLRLRKSLPIASATRSTLSTLIPATLTRPSVSA